MELTASDWLNLIAAAGYTLLGGYTLLLPTSKRLTKPLGGLMLGLASIYLMQAFLNLVIAPLFFQVMLLVASLVYIVASFRIARAFWLGWRAASSTYRTLAVAYVVLTSLVAAFARYLTPLEQLAFESELGHSAKWVSMLVGGLTQYASITLISVTSLAAALDKNADESHRAAAALTKAGLVGLTAGGAALFVNPIESAPAYWAWTISGFALVFAFSLVWATLGVLRRDRTILISAALQLGFILAGLAAGLAYRGLNNATESVNSAYAIMRVISLVLFVVAAAQGRIDGYDTKLRIGLSRTTVAAIFIAAIFIASEGTQQLFDNSWVGLFAGGLLMFFLAPIQRFADHLANAAVPAKATPAQQYAQTLRVVAADGRISPEEEEQLAMLADSLGLGTAEALHLRREVTS